MEKTSDDEDPLLASCDGIEFASYDRPGKLLHGHASLKLKISQVVMSDLKNVSGHLSSVQVLFFYAWTR